MPVELPGLSRADASVGRTVARLGRQVEVALAKVDLTTAQYRALVQLSEGAEASSSLASKLAVTPPSVTTVVDGLVQRGLVDRQPSRDDRRRVSLTLTGAGRRILAEADDSVGARLADILAEADHEAVTQALGGVERWAQAMDAWRLRWFAKKAKEAGRVEGRAATGQRAESPKEQAEVHAV
jgi:DNA-binding MarR family transcriptional regulator